MRSSMGFPHLLVARRDWPAILRNLWPEGGFMIKERLLEIFAILSNVSLWACVVGTAPVAVVAVAADGFFLSEQGLLMLALLEVAVVSVMLLPLRVLLVLLL